MKKRSKRYNALKAKLVVDKKYPIGEASDLISSFAGGKCDQSVEVAVRLGVDAKQSDQQVRGAINMPHGLGKKVTVLAFAKGAKEKEAKEAGADFVGGDDLVEKINGGWMDFDKVVATPDMMVAVSKVGKLLGPRGLMPNPKTGTVTFDIGKAIQECKAGKVAFKTDKAGIIHCSIGKVSFGSDKIKDNLKTLIEGLQKMKPQTSKGTYLKSITVSATTSPGIRLDVSQFAS